jgi:glycogen synthase
MLGWEFPPFISGGLGTACYGLTKAMDQLGIEVIFCLPKAVDHKYATHVKLLSPVESVPPKAESVPPKAEFKSLKNVTFHTISSPLQPYLTPDTYRQRIEQSIKEKQKLYGADGSESLSDFACGIMNYSGDMYTEVYRYAAVAAEIAKNEQFDIIHAHDWMTYPA